MIFAEFLEENEWDGELVLNDINFDMTCSFCVARTKVTELAFESYGKVLRANVDFIKGRYVHLTNEAIKDADEAFELGSDFLSAISGYISVEKFEACFLEI
ncbi:hypothetical protein [Enterococcus sp. AZ196]|uniref:hypothetical protein n=1 Tax=Enterococcus sp. AZ196 TaxID=2774659 RepID=UPI003D29F063